MPDDELIAVQIVQVLPPVRERSVLLGDENVPPEEWKRCLLNAGQRISELEIACRLAVEAWRRAPSVGYDLTEAMVRLDAVVRQVDEQ